MPTGLDTFMLIASSYDDAAVVSKHADGQSGLVVIAASDVEGRVTDATSRAKRQAKKQLQAVTDELAKVIEQL